MKPTPLRESVGTQRPNGVPTTSHDAVWSFSHRRTQFHPPLYAVAVDVAAVFKLPCSLSGRAARNLNMTRKHPDNVSVNLCCDVVRYGGQRCIMSLHLAVRGSR